SSIRSFFISALGGGGGGGAGSGSGSGLGSTLGSGGGGGGGWAIATGAGAGAAAAAHRNTGVDQLVSGKQLDLAPGVAQAPSSALKPTTITVLERIRTSQREAPPIEPGRHPAATCEGGQRERDVGVEALVHLEVDADRQRDHVE